MAAGILTRYGVGGAIGATFYLEVAETEDVDVFVVADSKGASPLSPFRHVYAWFVSRGAEWRDEHLVVGGWPLHLLPSTGALVDDALANVRYDNVDGQVVSVLTLEHLGAIALETGRSKDRIRVAQMWESVEFDRGRFLELVERFGLGDRWGKLRPLIEGLQ